MNDYLPKLEFDSYVTPYVGAPTKEFDDFGQTLDKRYETNVAAMDELDMLMQNVNTLGNDKVLKDKLLEDTRNQIKSVRDKGDWENSRNHIKEIAKRFKNDYSLNVAQSNFKQAQELQSKVDDMKLKGETPILFSDPNQFTTIDPATGKPRFFKSDVEKQLDYRTDQSGFFDGIKADSYNNASQNYGLGKSKDQDGNDISFWENKSSQKQWAGVTERKIIEQANRSLTSYLERPTGKQQMRVLTEQKGLSKQQAAEYIRQELINTGKEQVFSQSTTSSGTSMIAPAAQFRKNQAGFGPDGQPLGKKYVIDKNETQTEDASSGSSLDNFWGGSMWNKAFDPKKPDKVSQNQLYNVLENLQSSKSKDVSQGAKEYLDIIEEFKKANKGQSEEVINNGLTRMMNGQTSRFGAVNKDKITDIENKFQQINAKYKGTIMDSNFENAFDDKTNLKSARQIGWIKPNYNPDAGGMTSTQAESYDKTTKDVNLNNFDIVDGDADKIKELQKKGGKVTIKRVSNDVLGNGKGVGFLLEDDKGNSFVATPKSNTYGNELLSEVQSHFGIDDLTFKDKFKNIPRFTQGDKYDLGTIIEGSDYASKFSEANIKQLKNAKIQRTPQGFIMYQDGKVVKDKNNNTIITESPYDFIKAAFK